MAREQEITKNEVKKWSNSDEFMLICAVKRYGFHSWDKIAMELNKRRCTDQSGGGFTRKSCKARFYDLRRQLREKNDDASMNLDAMIEELRRIRIGELRQEIERRDSVIKNLELKIEKMKKEESQEENRTIVYGKRPVKGESDEPQGENQEDAAFPAKIKRGTRVKHEPLFEFLQFIRSQRGSSLFERRSRNQKSEINTSVVRQPIYLWEIEFKIRKGEYLHSIEVFYRDLLLVFNNAMVNYPKISLEHLFARKFHGLVVKDMNKKLKIFQPTTKKKDILRGNNKSITTPTGIEKTISETMENEVKRKDSIVSRQKRSVPSGSKK